MSKNITFGVEPTMREVPPGEIAEFKLGETKDWGIVETEFGDKYKFPIVLLNHPSYDNIPSSGMKMDWQSKSKAAEGLYYWMYDDNDKLIKWDTDISKELNGKFRLHRHETGQYMLEVLG